MPSTKFYVAPTPSWENRAELCCDPSSVTAEGVLSVFRDSWHIESELVQLKDAITADIHQTGFAEIYGESPWILTNGTLALLAMQHSNEKAVFKHESLVVLIDWVIAVSKIGYRKPMETGLIYPSMTFSWIADGLDAEKYFRRETGFDGQLI